MLPAIAVLVMVVAAMLLAAVEATLGLLTKLLQLQSGRAAPRQTWPEWNEARQVGSARHYCERRESSSMFNLAEI